MEEGIAFESAVADALSRCRHEGVLLAAVSGGADSTAMLVASAAARDRFGFDLHCLHVDHGIRSEAECAADVEAVSSLCRSLAVPCRVAVVPRGKILERSRSEGSGVEAAARIYRHAAWNEEARRVGASRVLVGHTSDDLLETALIRILRGAGPAGLAAMAEERGLVFRPLLSRTRSEVLEYLSCRGISFRTDSTNADPAYFRNRVRMALVPLLDREFPLWRSSVGALVRTQAEAAAFISEESSNRIRWSEEAGIDGLSTSAAAFFDQPSILRQEAIYIAFDELLEKASPEVSPLDADGPRRKPEVPRRSAVRLFAEEAPDAADLGAMRLERSGDRIVAKSAPAPGVVKRFSILVDEVGVYRSGPFEVTVSRDFSEASIPVRLPFAFRSFSPEDRVQGKTFAAKQPQAETPAAAIEDVDGIAAVFSAEEEDRARILVREGLKGKPDYAESVFFSILIQRGNYA